MSYNVRVVELPFELRFWSFFIIWKLVAVNAYNIYNRKGIKRENEHIQTNEWFGDGGWPKPKRHQSDVILTGPLGFSSDRGALFKGNKMDDTFPPTASVFEEWTVTGAVIHIM